MSSSPESADTLPLGLKEPVKCTSRYRGERSNDELLTCENESARYHSHGAFRNNQLISWTDDMALKDDTQ